MKVNIELTNTCNGQCIPCPHKNMKREQGFMDLELLEKILRELPLNVREIYPSLFGEPLMDKNLAEKLRLIRHRNATKIILFTNGSLLNIETNSFLYKYLDKIMISFHAWDGSFHFEELLKNITIFKQNAPPTLKIQVLLMKYGNMNDKEMVFRRFFPVGEGIIVPARNWDTYQTGLDGSEISCGRVHSLNILWDGRVCLCCRDHEGTIILGDINKQTIDEIWNSKRYREIRKQFNEGLKPFELCRNCYPT